MGDISQYGLISSPVKEQIIIDFTDTETFLVQKEGDGGDIFVVDTENGVVTVGGVAPVTGCRLVLPSENDSVTPTLAFGDGDTGFYEYTDDVLIVAISSNAAWIMTGTGLYGGAADAAQLQNVAPSSTVPGFAFSTDLDTGIGRAAADEVSIIAGGAEAIRGDKSVTAGETRLLLYDVDTGAIVRVSVGANDSGASGYKYLRVPN